MLAVQAQDFRAAFWALGVRSPASTAADVSAAIDNGSIVRSWPMRGTLHFVPPAELGWMLALTTPRLLAKQRTRRAQLGIDEHDVERAREVAVGALEGGHELTRAGFLRTLEENGIDTAGQRGYHLIWHLAQTGTLCWGRTEGTAQVLVLLDEWVREPRMLERDEALGEFLVRYLRGHGPATLKDFAWWSQLTMIDAKTALAVAGDRLGELRLGDVTLYYESDTNANTNANTDANTDANTHANTHAAFSSPPPPRDAVLALPAFDEYLLGYQNRDHVIDAELFERVVPGKNGMFLPIMVAGGRIAGTWRTTRAARSLGVRPEPFAALSQRRLAGFERSIRRYSHFLGTTISVTPAAVNGGDASL
ncbi:winged helix DNA-binding domain-containing protein [Cryobacterium tepidiphilum]|uniref:Winged helix DNA-binding domain-containing protein n=2 Tax=Cryobacterium tepidiphilum TaxID=2486026 RepID=A0A3M8LPG1_9MICO|nr:winged helix DNA-binding domain-containing protein [Cryobacterium tepidiphilum]